VSIDPPVNIDLHVDTSAKIFATYLWPGRLWDDQTVFQLREELTVLPVVQMQSTVLSQSMHLPTSMAFKFHFF
jgi:hypothetical protein